MKRILRRVAVVVVACTVVPATLLWLFQDQFVFFAGTDPVPPIEQALPRGRVVTYATTDDLTLEGWFVPARTPAGGCDRAATIVLFHGQNGSRASHAPLATALAERGVNVLLAEYRGFGGLGGTPSESALLDDAAAALDAAGTQPEVDASRIVVAGFSLGTGVAAELVTTRPAAGVVLIAPYTSMPDMAWHRLPVLPYGLLMRARFDTRTHVASTDVPVLVVDGRHDGTIPLEQSELVHASARRADPEVRIDGLDHVQLGNTPRMLPAVTDFVARHAGCQT